MVSQCDVWSAELTLFYWTAIKLSSPIKPNYK